MSPSKRLRALAAEIPSDRALRANLIALDELDGAFSDHAIALMGASIVEKALEVAVLSQLIVLTADERSRLFDYDKRGPLSDLSAKIKIGYALGIFGHKTRDDLDAVRQIRNAFAHTLNVMTFEEDAVRDLCNALHLPKTSSLITMHTAADTPKRQYIETVLTFAERVKSTSLNPPRPRNALAGVTTQVMMRWMLLP